MSRGILSDGSGWWGVALVSALRGVGKLWGCMGVVGCGYGIELRSNTLLYTILV